MTIHASKGRSRLTILGRIAGGYHGFPPRRENHMVRALRLRIFRTLNGNMALTRACAGLALPIKDNPRACGGA